MLRVHQINLQAAVGGGEIYTRWFTRALAEAGAHVTLYVRLANRFWDGLDSERVRIFRVKSEEEIVKNLPQSGAVLLTQSRIPPVLHDIAERDHLLTGFAHMPMFDRSPSEFARYATVFTVSKYCIDLLHRGGVSNVYPEPLYGTHEIDEDRTGADLGPIIARSPYHWDRRKGRDRVLSFLEPLGLRKHEQFMRRPGLTLGIVSLLSPIKQFPQLFRCVAERIAAHPTVNVEIFGNGGYAQVRDIQRAVSPIKQRVRFWGYQEAVRAIYPKLDYLMTGLPEKEALGLNVLEAQALGTPVLAPDAPPFTETIVPGQSGFLYRDPREDRGQDFDKVLTSLVDGNARPDPRQARSHLEKFSYQSMVQRARGVIEHLSHARAARFKLQSG